MKSRKFKWGNPLFVAFLAIAGIFGVSATVIDKQVKEEAVVEKAEAATTGYATKIYLEVTSTTWGTWSEIKSIWIYVDGGSMWQMHKINNQDDDRKLVTTITDNTLIGKNIKFALSKNSSSCDWTKETDGMVYNTSYHSQIPASDSTWRWFKWDWGDNYGKVTNYQVTQATVSGVDNGTTVCSISGEYSGIHNEFNESLAGGCSFTVSVTNLPLGKAVTVGQYSNSTCTTKTAEYTLDGSNNKSFTTFTFDKNYWFKPIFYDLLKVSFDNGTNWTYLNVDNPTSSTRTYSASSVSMSSGSTPIFKVGNTTVSVTYDQIYDRNIGYSNGDYHVLDTNSGDVSIYYNGTTYTATKFGSRNTVANSHHYVSNIYSGDFYPMTWFKYEGGVNKMKDTTDSKSAFKYLESGTKLYLMHCPESPKHNNYYGVSSLVTGSSSSASCSSGYVTVSAADWYYIELQDNSGDSQYNKFYIESYGITITYNLNGLGDSFTSREVKDITFSAPSNPTKSGYTFRGWYKESSCTNAWNFDSDTTSSDKTLYAKWTIDTVTFTRNNSSYGDLSAYSISDVPYNSTVTVSSNRITINGTTITATKADDANGYTYAFSSWTGYPAKITAPVEITANFTQTSGLAAAQAFAGGFNNALKTACDYYGVNTKKKDVTDAWSAQATEYGNLKEYEIYWFTNSDDTDITTFRGKYTYVYNKYGAEWELTDFASGVKTSSAIRDFSPISISSLFGEEDSLSTVIIIVASSVALLSVTALSILVIKKRKNKEE